MRLFEFIQRRVLDNGKIGYWATFRALGFGYWAMLAKAGKFQCDGVEVENTVKNGAARVFASGLVMIAVGCIAVVAGLLASAFLLLAFATLPLVAAGTQVAGRIAARRAIKAMERRVAAAREARHHGA